MSKGRMINSGGNKNYSEFPATAGKEVDQKDCGDKKKIIQCKIEDYQ